MHLAIIELFIASLSYRLINQCDAYDSHLWNEFEFD